MLPPRPLVALAFAGAVVIGGANFVAVSISNEGLPPFWGAALRFGVAATVMLGATRLARIALPRERALVGALLYGTTAFGATYALAYWALLEVPAGMLSVMLATTPLLTAFLAPLHGLERLRPRVVAGGLLACLGVMALVWEQLTLDVSRAHLATAVLFGVMAAESSVLVKQFPRAHPLATNGVGMAAGALLLLTASWLAGERAAMPASWRVTGAVAYLVVVGSIILFGLFLYTVARLPVTTVTYQFALMPVVTVALAHRLLGEPVTMGLVLGTALVVAGLYVGVSRGSKPPMPATVSESPGDPPPPRPG